MGLFILALSGFCAHDLIKMHRDQKTLEVALDNERDLCARYAQEMKVAVLSLQPVIATPALDPTTQHLINLAVKNTNSHEARNAAVQACKRLYRGA